MSFCTTWRNALGPIPFPDHPTLRRDRIVAVPNAVHGLNDGRFTGIGLNLFSQLSDVLIECASRAEVVYTPYGVEQPVTTQDFAGMGAEEKKELQFPC